MLLARQKRGVEAARLLHRTVSLWSVAAGKKRGRTKRPRARVVGSYGSLSKANDSTGFDLIAILGDRR